MATFEIETLKANLADMESKLIGGQASPEDSTKDSPEDIIAKQEQAHELTIGIPKKNENTINIQTDKIWHKCYICETEYRTIKGKETCEKKCLAKRKKDAEPYESITCQHCKQEYKYKNGSGDQIENIKRHMIKCERETKLAEEKQKAKIAKKMAEIKAMIMADIPVEYRNELITFIQQSSTTN